RHMGWSHDDCVTFVQRNAGAHSPLLSAASVRYHSKYPNIFVKYYSMPDWLDIFSFGPRMGKRKFDSVVHEYRFAVQKYQQNVSGLLDVIAGFNKNPILLTGRALMQELASQGRRSLHIMPHWHWKQAALPGPRNAVTRPILPGERLANVS